MGGEEIKFVQEAFESNYIAPLGSQVDAFEREFAEYVGIKHCVALSSGTAAMHLALRILGVGTGDEVIASTLTFIGSVTPVIFQRAELTFVDCDRASWNMDPDLLKEALEDCKRRGKMPKAVVPTDLYGQCCDLPQIVSICNQYDIPVVCDSAEALGAKYKLATKLRSASYARQADPHRHLSSGLRWTKIVIASRKKYRTNCTRRGWLVGKWPRICLIGDCVCLRGRL